ncbi:MAG: tRNA (adenosine(37)-N6)-dimethylallyltransferase MiaA [Spirosomataceae bacterium]
MLPDQHSPLVPDNQPLLVILGPTASGKTQLATQLALELGGEVISADSRQVYRGMDIGTGKDLADYMINSKQIPYHLIDVVEAGEAYHLFQYQQEVQKVLNGIRQRDKVPILCGGSGLYIEAVIKQFQFTGIPIDEALRTHLHAKTDQELSILFKQFVSAYTPLADTSTRKRLIRAIEIGRFLQANPTVQFSDQPPLHYQVFGIGLPTDLRRERITQRLYLRLQQGMVEEVRRLIEQGLTPDQLIYYGLEYKFITQYVLGELTHETMVERLNVAIHQFAKRQMTFFRKMERDGISIHWLDGTKEISVMVQEVLNLYNASLR